MAKIMVFEDDPLLAGMYQRMLGNAGFEVIHVGDGEAGLAQVAKVTPDLILMDIMMPRLNGLQALEALKNNPTTSDIPVIIMTQLTDVNDEQEVLSRGAYKYIDKGAYDPKAVVDMVVQVVNQTAAPIPKAI